jgi:hypothetical protein
VAPHGLTGAEVKRLNGVMHLMKRQVRYTGELWFLSTAKGLTFDAIANVQKRIGRLQGDNHLFKYSAWVFETHPSLHAHFVFIGNQDIAEALRRSAVCAGSDVRLVSDPDGLSKKYLVKERTPQAGYGRTDLGGRMGGSHKLNDGERWDRVRLSAELYRDALEAGLIQDWTRTNAKRSPERKKRRLQRLYPKKALRLSGQMLLFPEMSKPVARLQAFGGGYIPRAVAEEIKFRRRQLGLSQRQLAIRVGRSQGQISNAIRGHDPISAAAVNRIRDVLLRTPAPRAVAETSKIV